MAHAHFDKYAGGPATARAVNDEVFIDLGDLQSDDTTVRIAMNKEEALTLAAEILAAAKYLPE